MRNLKQNKKKNLRSFLIAFLSKRNSPLNATSSSRGPSPADYVARWQRERNDHVFGTRQHSSSHKKNGAFATRAKSAG